MAPHWIGNISGIWWNMGTPNAPFIAPSSLDSLSECILQALNLGTCRSPFSSPASFWLEGMAPRPVAAVRCTPQFRQGTPALQASMLGHHLGGRHRLWKRCFHPALKYDCSFPPWRNMTKCPWFSTDVNGKSEKSIYSEYTVTKIASKNCRWAHRSYDPFPSLGPAQPPNMPRPTPRAPTSWATVFLGGE